MVVIEETGSVVLTNSSNFSTQFCIRRMSNYVHDMKIFSAVVWLMHQYRLEHQRVQVKIVDVLKLKIVTPAEDRKYLHRMIREGTLASRRPPSIVPSMSMHAQKSSQSSRKKVHCEHISRKRTYGSNFFYWRTGWYMEDDGTT